MMDVAREYAEEPGTYWTNQLHNVDSIVGYRGDGNRARRPARHHRCLLRASVGTAGLITGVASALAGTSSGLNILAAVQLAGELGPGHTAATVACDTGPKYLAGDLFAR